MLLPDLLQSSISVHPALGNRNNLLCTHFLQSCTDLLPGTVCGIVCSGSIRMSEKISCVLLHRTTCSILCSANLTGLATNSELFFWEIAYPDHIAECNLGLLFTDYLQKQKWQNSIRSQEHFMQPLTPWPPPPVPTWCITSTPAIKALSHQYSQCRLVLVLALPWHHRLWKYCNTEHSTKQKHLSFRTSFEPNAFAFWLLRGICMLTPTQPFLQCLASAFPADTKVVSKVQLESNWLMSNSITHNHSLAANGEETWWSKTAD